MKYKRIIAITAACLAVCLSLPMNSFALKAETHGEIVSGYVLRDTNGAQYGFFDNLEAVQWKHSLQFDLGITPEYTKGTPQFRFEKAFFQVRTAYDSIFDITERYDNIRDKSPDDFELGRSDLETSVDLRECFVDFVGESDDGYSRANLRLGRQIVQWGEAAGFTLVNVVNPSDTSSNLYFASTEILKTPLWMGRLDLEVPGAGPFRTFSLQGLYIPDVRPQLWAPHDGPNLAPYAFIVREAFGPFAVDERESSSGLDTEYGLRLGTEFGQTGLYLYYFHGISDSPANNLTSLFATGTLLWDHPEQKTYGLSFTTFIEPLNFILYGEGSQTKDVAMVDISTLFAGGKGYSLHDRYQAMLGIDKSLPGRFVGTDSAITTNFQIYHTWVDDSYEQDLSKIAGITNRGRAEEEWEVSALATTDYLNGSLKPTVFVLHNFTNGGTTSARVSLKYSPDGNWYGEVASMFFLGDNTANNVVGAYKFIETVGELGLKIGWAW